MAASVHAEETVEATAAMWLVQTRRPAVDARGCVARSVAVGEHKRLYWMYWLYWTESDGKGTPHATEGSRSVDMQLL